MVAGACRLSTCSHTYDQALRKAYIEDQSFLPASWLDDTDTFHLRSDNSQRTLESAQALFSGLYPTSSDAQAQRPVS